MAAALIAGVVYLGLVWWLGGALVGDDSSMRRLEIAAATPKREAALEQIYKRLGADTMHGDVLARRMNVLRLLGGHCERIVEQLSVLSHDEEALAQARRCSDSPELQAMIAQAHLGLGQLDKAAIAVEAEVELAGGERSWTAEDAMVLVMGRRWGALERAALALAAEAPSAEAPTAVPLPGPLANLPVPEPASRSKVAEAWTCVALAARAHAGDATALDELRARPDQPGTGVCRILVADLTGALADLQVLSELPLDAGDLATATGSTDPVVRRGDLADRVMAYVGDVTGDTTTPPPYTFFERVEPRTYSKGPRAWRDSRPSEDLETLRRLVLTIRAPGDTTNYLGNDKLWLSSKELLVFPRPVRDLSGMYLRAARAALPYRASLDAAYWLVEVLPAAAFHLANVGRHDEAAAYLELAVDLARSLPNPGMGMVEDNRLRDLESLAEAAIATMLRSGDVDAAIALYDRVQQTPIESGDRERILGFLGERDAGIQTSIAIARGEVDAVADRYSYGYNNERVEPAIERLLAGDASGVGALTFEEILPLSRVGLPLIARRVERGQESLAELLRNYPRPEDGDTIWLFQHGHRLHLAESIGDDQLVAALRARAGAFLDVLTADDTSLLLAVVTSLD